VISQPRLEPRSQSRCLTYRRRLNFGALLEAVDFPNFVGTLIKDTFNAIVDSSIQQMEAYGKLVSEVATTIEDGCKLAGC
jgi:hypothetical protein